MESSVSSFPIPVISWSKTPTFLISVWGICPDFFWATAITPIDNHLLIPKSVLDLYWPHHAIKSWYHSWHSEFSMHTSLCVISILPAPDSGSKGPWVNSPKFITFSYFVWVRPSDGGYTVHGKMMSSSPSLYSLEIKSIPSPTPNPIWKNQLSPDILQCPLGGKMSRIGNHSFNSKGWQYCELWSASEESNHVEISCQCIYPRQTDLAPFHWGRIPFSPLLKLHVFMAKGQRWMSLHSHTSWKMSRNLRHPWKSLKPMGPFLSFTKTPNYSSSNVHLNLF